MTPRVVFLSVAATSVVALAGCTSQEAVGPASAVTTAPTNSVADSRVPPPGSTPTTGDDPTDTAATATSAVETTPATDVASTTTPPPSGQPTSTSTEYFAGGDEDGWLLLGRWTGSAWETALDDDGAQRTVTIRNGAAVSVHEADLPPIDGRVGSTAESCSDGRMGPVISPNARAPEEPGFGYRSLAFEADWNTLPRPVAVVGADVESYAEAGRAAFEGTDVDPVDGRIDQIVVADLDGDGDSESLVAFGNSGYSTLLLVDADTSNAVTVARDFETAPSTPTDTGTPSEPASTYRTLTVADLDGDGFMEFVVHSWVGGVATVTAYTYDGDGVDAVLSVTC